MAAFLGRFLAGPSTASANAAAPVWPRRKIVDVLKRRYGKVSDLGEDSGYALYGVADGEIQFAVIMAMVEGATDKISQVGFLARFSGFNLSQPQLDQVNRNLHISIAAFHSDGDLYLIGGVEASGAFNEGMFLLVLEAWKRDLLVIIQSMSLSHTLADNHPALHLAKAIDFAANRAADRPDAGGSLFSSYAGGAQRTLSVCGDCAGRGKTGFFARSCEPCAGSGFVRVRGR